MRYILYIKAWFDHVSGDGGIDALREALTEIVVAAFCVIGLIALVMAGVEVHLQGKTRVVIYYSAAYLPVLISFVFRRKLPFRFRINIVLLSLYALAVLILCGVGLSGAGIILLATFCVLTAAFQGVGPGLVSIGLSVAAIMGTGWAMSTGRLPIDIVAMTNSTRLEAWSMAVILFFLVVLIMVLCISLFQNSLQKTIDNLQEKKVLLQRTNQDLEEALRSSREKKAALKESEEFHKRLFEESPTALSLQDFSKVGAHVDTLLNKGVEDITGYLKTHGDEIKDLIKSVSITQVNLAAAELYGAGSRGRLLMGLESLIKSDDAQHFVDQIACFTSGEDRYEGEARKLNLQGETLDVIIRKTVLNREKNGLSKILVSVVDVTALYRAGREKQALEKQLNQTRKMETIGTLAGGIAHDFNNILFPISGHTEMLLAEMPEDSSHRKSLDQIYKGTQRAKELVKQILSFSRQEPGDLKIIKIQPILTEVLKLIRATIPATIEIRQDIDENCGPIKADPTQIHQILMNLFTNAWHAVEDGGCRDGVLAVSLSETEFGASGPQVCLVVRDTGTGIKGEIMDKIFDPFFTTKEQGRGTGMGLSVIHGIVSKMGGEIRVKSREGKGTAFHIYFPLEKGADQVAPGQAPVGLKGGNEHIFLIDDEKEVLSMETKMLERLGYAVSSCTDSNEALKIFQADPGAYDLVISDVAMPHIPGDALAVKLQNIRPDIPILLCTGYSRTVTEAKALDMGIRALLAKPVSMKELDRAVRDILDTPQPCQS